MTIVARRLVQQATTELTAARYNLTEVIETLQTAQASVQKASLALSAAHSRVRQGEARLRSAYEALGAAAIAER